MMNNEYELNNQLNISWIGFGTWKILKQEEAETALETAIKSGYRLLDTASKYKNEEIIGTALKHTDVKRQEIFIQGKVWNTDRGYDKTLAAFDRTLKKLQLDYLDAYMIHWPAGPLFYDEWEKINADTYRALERLYEDGVIKTIGVCNYDISHLKILECTANIKPMLNQVEFHPGVFPEKLYTYCMENDIQMQAWSPLGNGKMLEHAVIGNLADKYQKSPAQICLRWCVQNKVIPLPKSVNSKRIKENICLQDFFLSDEEMQQLKVVV